jgi:subtilase family serine protease
VQSGYDGSGTTVAVVIDSDVSRSDLNAYTAYFQTPATARSVTTRNVDGGGAITADGQLEATLDAETVAGLAPGANVVIYALPDLSDLSIIDALNQSISDGTVNVVSMSFAGCESPYAAGEWSPIFQTGTAAGMTFVASSGDQGNECYNGPSSYVPGVGYPASDPNVVGLGGNESTSSLANPVAWNDHLLAGGAQGSTGGGVSTVFAFPSYQSGIPGLASGQYRNVPDIALPSVYGAIYMGDWVGIAGTSWSAPAAAALLAEIRQYCRANLGNANVLLYKAFGLAHYADFLDVTSGNNQFAGSSPYFTAKIGYDNTTGLGLPLGMPLAQTLCPNRTLASAGRAAAAAQSGRRAAQAYTVDLRPSVRGLTDTGRRPQNATTRIALVLHPTNTPAADEANAIAVLRAAGLTVVRTFRNHLVIDAEGPSGAIERLFGTTIDNFTQARHGTPYATVRPATIPASLAPYLGGVFLDNVVKFHHIGSSLQRR